MPMTEKTSDNCVVEHAGAGTDDQVAVKGFLSAWDALDVDSAVAYFRVGAVHHEATSRSGGGGRDVAEYLDWAAKTAEAFRSEVHRVVVVGGVVLTERIDFWTIGGREYRVPTVGIFDLEDGSITSWADTTCRDLTQTDDDDPEFDRTAEHVLTAELGDAPSGPAPLDADDADARIAQLGEELHEWRRRATMWRERALDAQSLGEVLQSDVDDLRRRVVALEARAFEEPAAGTVPGELVVPADGAGTELVTPVTWPSQANPSVGAVPAAEPVRPASLRGSRWVQLAEQSLTKSLRRSPPR